jgi:hypothetical protein
MKPQYIGTWRITEMDTWDADYVNLVGPGYLRIDREGGGFMQSGAVEAALDCRGGDGGANQRLEFTFQGFDEGDPVSGRGRATVSGSQMTGHICFHRGEESGFTAVKGQQSKTPTRSSPKVIRLPQRPDAAKARPLPEMGARQKIRHGQAIQIRISRAEKTLLEEHTLVDSDYTDRLASPDSGTTWTGSYTLDDLEDMLGYLGEGEGHAEDKNIARKLRSLIRRLSEELDSYDDGG